MVSLRTAHKPSLDSNNSPGSRIGLGILNARWSLISHGPASRNGPHAGTCRQSAMDKHGNDACEPAAEGLSLSIPLRSSLQRGQTDPNCGVLGHHEPSVSTW